MKTALLSILLGATLAASAAEQSTPPEGDRPTLVIRKKGNPIMPQRLIELGVQDGEVRLVINVDSTGKLSEWLVVGYTHPALADAVVAAVKRWDFEPPRWRGEPISIQRELQFRLESHGTVVSIYSPTYIDSYLAQRFPDRYVFKPCTLKELDRIPTPLNAPAPIAPKLPDGQTERHVVVEFFIDPTGAVRMPSVISSEDPDLEAASVQAVRDWRFEPPTRQGRPTLVHVQQTFRFQR